LPPTLEFQFEERDVAGEAEEAQLQLAKAQVITEMTQWTVNGQSVLTVPQIMSLAAAQGVIPDDWTPAAEDVTSTDEEDAPDESASSDLSERVYRARLAFPDEPIVRYSWPANKTRILRAAARRSFYFPKVLRRSISQIVNEYRDRLTNLVYNAWTRIENKMSVPSVMQTGFRTEHKRLIRELGPQAYGEGLREGNVSIEDADNDDKAAISAWVANQQKFVNEFSSAVVGAAQDKDKRQEILSRVELWASSMSNIGNAGLMSAQQNMMATWKLNAHHITNEHCVTCMALDGKRHRMKWFTSRGFIPREIGSKTLACGGWNCGCGLVDDQGNLII
jgi:hypothetical protein